MGENYQLPIYKSLTSLGPSSYPALRRKRNTILTSADKSQGKDNKGATGNRSHYLRNEASKPLLKCQSVTAVKILVKMSSLKEQIETIFKCRVKRPVTHRRMQRDLNVLIFFHLSASIF